MPAARLAQLLAAARRRPDAPEAWLALARHAGRTPTTPCTHADLPHLLQAWSACPQERALEALVLPLVARPGSRVGPAVAAGAYWSTRTQRLGSVLAGGADSGPYDPVTGMPLEILEPLAAGVWLAWRWIPIGQGRGDRADAAPGPGFFMTTTPLSVAQVEALGQTMPAFSPPNHWPTQKRQPDRPAVFLTWEDAVLLASAASGRLPSERERAWAVGGPHEGPYPWGSDAPGPEQAVLHHQPALRAPGEAGGPSLVLADAEGAPPLLIGSGPGGGSGWADCLREAGAAPAGVGGFGLLGGYGNVRDWCADWFAPDDTPLGVRPLDGDRIYRAVAGADWGMLPELAADPRRARVPPCSQELGDATVGVRVLRELLL